MGQEEKKVKSLRCVVVSDKMHKTRVGVVERLVKHPTVGKYIKKSTKFMFHDENHLSKAGDHVLIRACRPLSAHKSFVLEKVISAAD